MRKLAIFAAGVLLVTLAAGCTWTLEGRNSYEDPKAQRLRAAADATARVREAQVAVEATQTALELEENQVQAAIEREAQLARAEIREQAANGRHERFQQNAPVFLVFGLAVIGLVFVAGLVYALVIRQKQQPATERVVERVVYVQQLPPPPDGTMNRRQYLEHLLGHVDQYGGGLVQIEGPNGQRQLVWQPGPNSKE